VYSLALIMDSGSGSSASAAEQLRQKHTEGANASHHVTVEDAPDEEFSHSPTEPNAAAGTEKIASWNPTMSTKAAGKQKAESQASSAPLDTGSHEVFPELGPPKTKAETGTAPIWSAKNFANGQKGAGKAAVNGSSGAATPASGTSRSSPVPRSANGAGFSLPNVSLPGRNVESIILEPQHILSRQQLKRPLPDIIKDFNRKSRVNITMTPVQNGKIRFEAAGSQDVAQQALRDLVQQIGTKQTIQVPIPQSVRAHIIGKGGATIKSLQERTGARIQLPKAEDGAAPMGDDEDGDIYVTVEGNAISAAAARDQIRKIVLERGATANARLRNVPAEFYPFLAGPANSLVSDLERRGVQVRIPPHKGFSSQPPPAAPAPGQRPVFQPAADDSHIQLAGDRMAIQAARQEIERQVEELHRQLMLEQLSIQRGRHQFIIGDRGVPVDDFFEETGCLIILPTDEDDDMITIIGPDDKLAGASDKAIDLAMNMQSSNIDISRFHRQAPGGASQHARNLTRYLRQKKELERLEKQHSVHINTPFSDDGVLPWELYSRDGKNAIRAQSEIKNIVDGHPPSRMGAVPVDPFFHQFLRSDVQPRVRQDYGVHMVVPEATEGDAPVLLVFESLDAPEPYQIPRAQPTEAEVQAFAQGIRDAQQHILDLINKQEAIKSESIDVPQK
jgi:hypothetical protein